MIAIQTLGLNSPKKVEHGDFTHIPVVTGEEGRKVLEDARMAKTGHHRSALIVFWKSCFIVLLYTLAGWGFFGTYYHWTFIDCLYMSVVITTTVGYGDITPDKDDRNAQTFLWMYAVIGVFFLGKALSEIVMICSSFVKTLGKQSRHRALKKSADALSHGMMGKTSIVRKTGHQVGVLEDSVMASWKQTAKFINRHYGTLVRMVFVFITLVSTWTLGACIVIAIEPRRFDEDGAQIGFDFWQGFYCAVITSLSVGLGDFSPQTQWGRLAFVIYIPVSVVLVLGSIAQVMHIIIATK
jgi:hypothetical protein